MANHQVEASWMFAIVALLAGCTTNNYYTTEPPAAVSSADSAAATGAGGAGVGGAGMGGGGPANDAKATLEAKSGSQVTATATFHREDDGYVTFTITVSGAPAGAHAVHIH